ncbi:hypothetical protein BXOR1_11135 [Xanthomonas oryzae pv. oryzicola]|nr:hypothetical protein ACU15_04420 [Xanthomonas oryzae pv. oryzicola]KOR38699.1 hypothetical protein ADT27_22525 [Xanthomonas oryzae]OLK88827.1 hypothetical protein BXOR1_11135 [Xanthomonas oryzae pv. oryzicola]QEO96061.1 histidinol-phosphate aminotransferase [Xanthomonas oryzae pv. oryzicola]
MLAKLTFYSGNSLPVTAAPAGLASLRDPALVTQRRTRTAATRRDVMEFPGKHGYACTTSESNCFMVDVKRPAAGFRDDMATHGVFIGRSWPVWRTWSRITVGTEAEMARFKQAFVQVMAGEHGLLPVPAIASAVTDPMEAFFRYA